MEEMFRIFSTNRQTISFWLNECVFPKDLKHFPKHISASASDLPDANISVGFSGTKDNKEVLPGQISFKPPTEENIQATDGKMIYLMSENVKCLDVLEENKEILWKRFVRKVF